MFAVSRLQKVAGSHRPGRWLSSMLEVSPASSLLDCQVSLAGSGLEPGSLVRLEARLEDPSQSWSFQSVSQFQTDERGEFSTASQSPPTSQ